MKVQILETGGKLPRGYAKAKNGLTVLDEDTFQFNGPSHSEGGIPMSYGGKNVEVEGGETAYKADDGSLAIMGNMTNPITGRKFKADSKILAKNEQKNNKLMDYSIGLVKNNDPYSKFGSLKFNGGMAMMIGTKMKKDSISTSKEHLADMQQAMLDVSDELGVDPQAFSKGIMKKGGRIPKGQYIAKNYQAGGKPWEYRGTKTEGLDPAISGFVDLLQKKGLTGFSGPESGVSNRDTKSGHASRHKTGEALDAFISQPDAYNKIVSDPELSGYLINNGLTAIDEYDPNVASQTGASAGHVHIGYDRGTGISDKFRVDASSRYKATNPSWGWGTTRAPKGKPTKGAPQGDQQYFKYETERVGDHPPQFEEEGYKPNRIDAGPYSPVPDLSPLNKYPVPTNAEGLNFNQVLPELYAAATNKMEPVFAQKFQPELYEPYQVSFQDRRNKNQSTFRASSQMLSDNPESIGALQAQKFAADDAVGAEEFRTNQAIANEITNKNVALLNDANQKNLQLADTQFVRQSTAKSKTKATTQAILNSVSSKIQQNQLEQRTLQVYENLYPHFRYDQDNNYSLEKVGAPGQEYLTQDGSFGGNGGGGQSSTRTREEYNATGKLTKFTRVNDSDLNTATKQVDLKQKQQNLIFKQFNNRRVSGFPKRINYPSLLP